MYYLLNQHLDWVRLYEDGGSGYYGTLFGPKPGSTKSNATALGALFEEIILVGADSSLPDRGESTSDGSYWHPDFRIRVPNSDYAEWDDDNKELAAELLASPAVVGSFRSNYSHIIDEFERLQMLCRLLLQMRAAQTYDAVIVGDANLCALHDVVLGVLSATDRCCGERFISESLALNRSVLSIVGLEFNCPDLDAFSAVRQSKEISHYAEQFRQAVSVARSAPDLREKLLYLMREARETYQVANKIASGFEAGSTITSVAGLIPFLGSATGLIGIGTDVGARTARHVQNQREWYAIGAHMQRVALDDLLSRS
ncbi:TPA: hypothetical protein QDB21_006314 [Burkholderia vietnamiensis]|nr:hypothetical protein [Burkholderia vietnamiensis]